MLETIAKSVMSALPLRNGRAAHATGGGIAGEVATTKTMMNAALVDAIRGVFAANRFGDEGHWTAWARPRHAGTRTAGVWCRGRCASTGLLAPSRAGASRNPRSRDGTIVPEAVDAMSGTDYATI